MGFGVRYGNKNLFFSHIRPFSALILAGGLSACSYLPTVSVNFDSKEKAQAEAEKKEAEQVLKPNNGPEYACSANQGTPFVFKKKLAVTQVVLASPDQAVDLPNFGLFYSNELAKSLESSEFVVTSASHYSLSNNPSSKSIMALASQLGVQLVVVGQLNDMSIKGKKWYSANLNRRFNLTLKAFDGYTGALITTAHFKTNGKARIKTDRHLSALTPAFFDTAYGKEVKQSMARQVDFLKTDLSCLPMTANIIRVDNMGVHFDVGGGSLVRPGDRFQVIRRVEVEQSLATGPLGNSKNVPNYYEQRIGPVTIKSVNPQTSVGRLDNRLMQGGISPGDIIRAW